MQDSFRHQGLRKQLTEQLSDKGIYDAEVLDAINKIPRHLFMDNAFVSFLKKSLLFVTLSFFTIKSKVL